MDGDAAEAAGWLLDKTPGRCDPDHTCPDCQGISDEGLPEEEVEP